jgi:hypothetical protein
LSQITDSNFFMPSRGSRIKRHRIPVPDQQKKYF